MKVQVQNKEQKPLRVLQLNLISKICGGAEDYLFTLIKGLLGCKVSCDYMIVRDSCIDKKYVGVLAHLGAKIHKALFKFDVLSVLLPIAQYDIIHFHNYKDLWLGRFIKQIYPGKKLIFSAHVPPTREYPELNFFDLVIANSLFVERELKNKSVKQNISLIYPCVDSQELLGFINSSARAIELEGNPKLLMGARLNKNQSELVEIFSKLTKQLPNARLYFSHPGTASLSAHKELEKLILEKNLADKIQIVSKVSRPEFISLMKQADIFAYTHPDEPFGLVLLEAALLNKIIVSYPLTGGGMEILQDYPNVTFVDMGDKQAFASVICEMTKLRPTNSHNELNKKLSDKFGLDEFIDKHLKLYFSFS